MAKITLMNNKKELLLQIKLIESCDEDGIIIFKGDTYQKEKDKWVLFEKNKIEIMQQGEINRLMSRLWYRIDY